MRKYGAILAVAVLLAAAFFLPEVLSEMNDRQMLDNPVIQTRDGEQEGFAEAIQLTVPEKLALLRSGSLTGMELDRGEAKGVRIFVSSGADGEIVFRSFEEDQKAVLTEGEADYDDEEYTQLWEGRLEAVRTEVRNLQSLGGLPMLWDEGSELSYTGFGEVLYMDSSTRMSFQVYRVTMGSEFYSLGVTVDAQSGRLLSFILHWNQWKSPRWGMQGASNFGSAWRNYWGMDSIESAWYNDYNRTILEKVVEQANRNGDYTAVGQISFSYDGQPIPVPLGCWANGGRSCAITWNA